MNGERAMVLGAVLGLVDTLVIAAGIAAWKHGAYPSVFPAVVALGMMPALVVGIGVGYLAAESTARSIGWRRRMMVGPALAGVALLGIAFGLEVIVPLAASRPSSGCWCSNGRRATCRRASGRSRARALVTFGFGTRPPPADERGLALGGWIGFLDTVALAIPRCRATTIIALARP